jgi:phage replication-related protein YjqB (UPF0714/DUF867 family)
VTHDYWMFEGLRETGNDDLHVTSTGCDDGVAVSLCAGSLNALSLHGFEGSTSEVLVGGRNTTTTNNNNKLAKYLYDALDNAGFHPKYADQVRLTMLHSFLPSR